MKSIRSYYKLFLASLPVFLAPYCLNAQTVTTYKAIQDFTKLTVPNYTTYVDDNIRGALMINSSQSANHDKWAAAHLLFMGVEGAYDLSLTALDEIDGESSYKIIINGVQIGSTFQNQFLNLDSKKDYQPEVYSVKNVILHKGDTIRVESNCVSNGKQFLSGTNLDFARGRWTKLELTSIPIPNPVTIVKEPVDTAVLIGAKTEFKTQATGAGVLAFRWQKNGDSTTLGTDSILSITASIADSGSKYFCTVTNGVTVATTRKAELTVSHDSCHSIFSLDADTLTVSESKPVLVKSQATCSQGYYWSVLSGPAPALLDAEVQNLEFTAPRVSETTLLTYQFTATFNTVPRTKNVVVRVLDSIPDPLFDLTPTYNWDGNQPLVIRPTLSNKSALEASPLHPTLNYTWSTTEEFTEIVASGDSITLSHPLQSTTIKLNLCINNGGLNTCKSTTIQVLLPTTALGKLNEGWQGQRVLRSANTLYWSAPALVRVWNITGRLLWTQNGKQGEIAKLPAAVFSTLVHDHAKLEIISR